MNSNNLKSAETEDTIDLVKVFKALWKRAWIILITMIAGGVAMFAYSYFMITPLYKSSATFYVNNSTVSVGSTSISLSDLSAAQDLANTYTVLIKAWPFMEDVIETADLDYDYDELADMISANPVNDTEIFEVIVTSDDPQEAQLIANTIADLLPDNASDIIEGSNIKIVATALLPDTKSSPNNTRNAAMGALLGIVVGCIIIFALEWTNDEIEDEGYLLQNYDIPLLAAIPDLKSTGAKGGYYGYGAYKKEAE